MLEYSREQFERASELSDDSETGVPMDAHLRQVAVTTGKDIEELENESFGELTKEIPYQLMWHWRLFCDLGSARTYNMSGPNPLSYEAILAYSKVYHVSIKPWEVDLIRSIDLIYLEVHYGRLGRTQSQDTQ